jgi:phage gp46-like protein
MERDKTIAPVTIEGWADIRELIRMSIGTDKGSWWADPGFGSELWILRQEGKITGRTAGTVQRMIADCLTWLERDGIAAGITCRAEQSGKNEIAYTVTAEKPNGDPVIVKDTWHGL